MKYLTQISTSSKILHKGRVKTKIIIKLAFQMDFIFGAIFNSSN